MNWLRKIIAFLAALLKDKPAPTPDPKPEPTKPPAEPSTVGDEIFSGDITFDDTNVAAWEQNVTLADVKIKDGKISWTQTGKVWPEVLKDGWLKPSIGNIWVVGKVDGAWRAATWDWIGPGQRLKELPNFSIANDIHGPLEGWTPVKGEEVGFFLSSFARAFHDPKNQQRSQIVKVQWL